MKVAGNLAETWHMEELGLENREKSNQMMTSAYKTTYILFL
jgi:hypothetical protein